MSVLAMPISLLAAILPGDSGIDIIMVVDFIMLSLVQAIIAAEAGVSANAEADSIAAVINVFMLNLAGKKPTGPPANGIRIFHPERFGKKTFFLCCVATASRRLANRGAVGRQLRTCPARASSNSRLWLGVLGDAADRYLGFAGGLAARRYETPDSHFDVSLTKSRPLPCSTQRFS